MYFFHKTAYNLKQFFFSLHKTLRAGLHEQTKNFHQLNDKDISIQEEIFFLFRTALQFPIKKKTEKRLLHIFD